eukprot:2312983-Rhodomonas_salina.1
MLLYQFEPSTSFVAVNRSSLDTTFEGDDALFVFAAAVSLPAQPCVFALCLVCCNFQFSRVSLQPCSSCSPAAPPSDATHRRSRPAFEKNTVSFRWSRWLTANRATRTQVRHAKLNLVPNSSHESLPWCKLY